MHSVYIDIIAVSFFHDLDDSFITFSLFTTNPGEASQASHNQMAGAMDKECGGGANNNMATNYTVNGGVQKDSVPWKSTTATTTTTTITHTHCSHDNFSKKAKRKVSSFCFFPSSLLFFYYYSFINNKNQQTHTNRVLLLSHLTLTCWRLICKMEK